MRSLFLIAGMLCLSPGVSLQAEPIILRTRTIQSHLKAKVDFDVQVGVPFIVSVRGPVYARLKLALREAGLHLLRYIPENAFIVKAESEAATSSLESIDEIQRIYAYRPEFKYFPVKEGESNFYAVMFFDGRVVYLQADSEILSRLAENPGIEFIERFNPMAPLTIRLRAKGGDSGEKRPGDYSDLDGSETGTRIINAESACEAYGLSGDSEIAGMADTGLDVGKYDDTLHPDFQGKVIYGYNASMFNADPLEWSDPMGHGTHVAGSIVGNGSASGGRIRGVAWGAEIVVASFWSHVMNNMLISSDLDKTFGTAFAKGVRVHSDSWGGSVDFGVYDATACLIDKIAWERPEMLFVFAAGNSGVDADGDGKIDPDSISSPGTAKNVLTVGASENVTTTGGLQVPVKHLQGSEKFWPAEPIASDLISDNANGLAMFSARGPVDDGRIKPDLVAPGTNILSTRSHYPSASSLWAAYNSDYAWSGGTSMSAPIAAGAAVLVREYYGRVHHLDIVSASLVKATLINGAYDMYPGQFGDGESLEISSGRPNSDEGWGRVDLKRSLASEEGLHFEFDDNLKGLSTGERKDYRVEITGAEKELRVTLAYTDYPGTVSSGRALVNDLDLIVTPPSGGVLFPNRLEGPDNINNIEGVDIPEPEKGVYLIQVHARNVPQGNSEERLPYSLVISY